MKSDAVASDKPGRRDPLFRDNLPARYDVLLEAVRAIANHRSSAFRTYEQDHEYFKKVAADALRDAGEQR